MSTLSKQQLGVQNQTSFPNNTTGYISPSLLRGFNTDIIDSTVNQTGYNTDSSSVSAQLVGLNAYTQSLNTNFITSASLNASTASLSASLTTTINTKLNTSTFNTYTASTNGRLNTIEANYASVNAVNTFGQDQIIIGSLDIKESLIVDFSASFGTHVSMSGLDNYGDSRLGANASSVNTLNGFVYITNPDKFNLGSVNWLVYSASIASASAFIANYTGQPFNQFSQSVDVRLDSLELFSSSLDITYATDAELAAVSASIMSTLNTFSSSYKTDSGSFNTRITNNSSSFNTFSSSYTTESASFQSQITTNSSSFSTFSSSYKVDSSSFDSRVDVIETTYAKTGSNVFVGDQYVSNGVLQVATYPQTGKTWFSPTAIEAVGTASVAYEQFVDGGGYDAFNVVTTIDAGTEFRDLPSDTFVLNTWLAIPQNTGNNPAPQFKRGLGISGSVNISGSTTINGNQTITGSVILSSSADVELTVIGKTVTSASVSGIVGNITVVSNTASIDMSRGNFFTLNIPSASNTFITATNIQPGQTVAVKLSQASNSSGSVTFNPSQFKFWSGSAQYNTGSQVTGSTDIFTFVTFDTSSLWTTIVKNLV
jgi:hypothetical protein